MQCYVYEYAIAWGYREIHLCGDLSVILKVYYCYSNTHFNLLGSEPWRKYAVNVMIDIFRVLSTFATYKCLLVSEYVSLSHKINKKEPFKRVDGTKKTVDGSSLHLKSQCLTSLT